MWQIERVQLGEEEGTHLYVYLDILLYTYGGLGRIPRVFYIFYVEWTGLRTSCDEQSGLTRGARRRTRNFMYVYIVI